MSELSAYEKERLANIRRNEAVLASLGLGPGEALIPQQVTTQKPRKKRPRPEQQPERREVYNNKPSQT